MQHKIRAGIAIALVAGGVAGLAAMSSVSPVASGVIDPPAETGGFASFVGQREKGRIELATDPTGKLAIAYFDSVDDATPDRITYDLRRSDRCLVDTSRTVNGKKILEISLTTYLDDPAVGATGTVGALADQRVGLVDNGLGSYEQTNCNQSNGRIEPGVAIRLRLGDLFSTETFVDWAEFDIEGKFGARLEAVTDAAGRTAWFAPLKDNDASDNAADAGAGDNNEVVVGVAGAPEDNFRTITMAPVSDDGRGQLALEGGGDFDLALRAQNRTVLHLSEEVDYEYVLVCEAQTDLYTPNGADFGTFPEGTVRGIIEDPSDADWSPLAGDVQPSQARLFRYYGYQHTDGAYTLDESGYPVAKTACDPIGANLSAGQPGVLLEPSDDSAFLRVELTWVIPADQVNGTDDPAFDRTVDLDGPGALFTPEPAQYCEGFGPSSATSDPTSTFDPADPGVADHRLVDPADPTSTAFVPWCVISDERELTTIAVDGVDVDVIVQVQVWDGIGDPYFR